MVDWLQLHPGETILHRSRQTTKGAKILASGSAVSIIVAIPLGAALSGLIFESHWQPLWRQMAVIAWAALGGAVLTFFIVYRAMEIVITDRRVVYRRGLVSKRQMEMWLDEIAEIKPDQRAAPGRPFRLISREGRSLTVSTLADLDQLRRQLVRQTGLPDPMAG